LSACGGRSRPALFFRLMELTEAQLTAEVRRLVSEQGYELVDVRQRGAGTRLRLQVRVERVDAEPGHGITVDECAVLSRVIEAWLEGDQGVRGRYVLEVSSPGIERPIRFPEHWARFRGHDVQVRVEGQGRFRATIVGMVDGAAAVALRRVDGTVAEVALEHIREATLVVDWSAIARGRAEGGH